MSDDDWYEQALRELEGESNDSTEDDNGDEAVSVGDRADTKTDTDETIEVEEDSTEPDETPTDRTPETTDSTGEPATPTTETAGEGESTPTADDADPFGVTPKNHRQQTGVEEPPEGDDQFGFFAVGDDGDTDDDFGFGDFGAGSGQEDAGEGVDAVDSEPFEEEEFESSIDRIELGIEGLDQMILGGVPNRSLMVVIGSAGTGKTTFGLQFLNHGLEQGERAVFITLEQSSEAIFSTAEEMGWSFREYEAADTLAVVSLDPIELANSLSSLGGDITRLIEDFGADRLVLDSVSLLEMMYDHPAKRRSEVFDFTRSLKRAGITTMLTSEASKDNPYASRHGIVEYLTDAVFVLQYVRQSNQETRLAVEIQKIRNANHSRETKPYEITDSGISVYRQASIF